MKHKFILVLGVMSMILAGPVFSEDSLSIAVDYAAFLEPTSGKTYVEVYYSVYRNQLGFISDDTSEQAYAGVFAQINFFGDEGNMVDSASAYFIARMDKAANRSDSLTRYFDYLPIQLAPGTYVAEIKVIDDVSKNSAVRNLAVNVPDYAQFDFILSDLELAYEIREIDPKGKEAVNPRLVKEERLVIPNPGRVFQIGRDSTIDIYCELYGLLVESGRQSNFMIEYQVKDATGNLVHDFGQFKYPAPGTSAVLSHSLDISSLGPGEYYLSLKAIDPARQKEALAVKPFYLFDPQSQVTVSDRDVEELVNIAWYHLSEAEKIQIQKLTRQGQVHFLEQFWREMDDDPTNPENPAYDEAIRRYLYANEFFSTRQEKSDGWKTDRGRIYITYGPYDDRTDIALPNAGMPMIKWEYYNIENGVIFVFSSEDMAGASDYRLVHSTHPNEIHDPDWVDVLEQEVPEENWQRQGDNFGK